MELTILGSGAAEGIPAIFCECPVCKEAWKRGGKDLRLLAAYKLSDTVRVDFGPCSLAQEYRYSLHSERLRHLIITHPHEDHLDPTWLELRRKWFSVLAEDNILNVYGTAATFERMRHIMCHSASEVDNQLRFHTLNSGEVVEIPEENMTLYPLLANHCYPGMALFYIIRNKNKWILIGNDTGYFPEESWKIIENLPARLDVVILDSTCTKSDDAWNGHMGAKAVLAVKERLEKNGHVDENTQVFVNHFSHNGGYVHEELEKLYNPHGIQVGYDGCVIEY